METKKLLLLSRYNRTFLDTLLLQWKNIIRHLNESAYKAGLKAGVKPLSGVVQSNIRKAADITLVVIMVHGLLFTYSYSRWSPLHTNLQRINERAPNTITITDQKF